jgi:LemA protein
VIVEAVGGCLLLLVLVAVSGAIWAIWRYNNLVSLKYQVANAWKQTDVQLKRRHDLIPNLIASVKGEMQFEQDTLEKVIAARNSAVAARGPRPRTRSASPASSTTTSRRATTRRSRSFPTP